ncbi:sulfur carrier protein ThiS [Candidatus Halobeggiatoa sp. HSG11]|nr:sulfur carrier protein ThiS [Candidatus Halobeggiatoa sp. HSG11]
MPEILLNGEPKQITNDLTVAALIKDLDLENKRLAVEINQEIVPRSQFEQCILAVGDKVEIIHAVGGG